MFCGASQEEDGHSGHSQKMPPHKIDMPAYIVNMYVPHVSVDEAAFDLDPLSESEDTGKHAIV